jgi:hypothetical protein
LRSTTIVFSEPQRLNYRIVLLITTFISGFLLGAYIVSDNAELYSSFIRSAVKLPVSDFTALFHIVFPFVSTALIYRSGKSAFYSLVCFIQALILGVSTNAIYVAYGNAQWLIFTLLLFSSTISFSALLWFWFRHMSKQRSTARRDYFICLIASILAVCLDHCVLSPFLRRLFH